MIKTDTQTNVEILKDVSVFWKKSGNRIIAIIVGAEILRLLEQLEKTKEKEK